jgi:hypothetical protein
MSFQVRADEALQKLGTRAPAPILGETADQYRRRVMRDMARLLPRDYDMRRVEYRQCSDKALDALEPQLFAAVDEASRDVRAMRRGELREVTAINPDNGQKTISFFGPNSFVTTMGRECRLLTDGLFQRNVPKWQAMSSSIPSSETRRNTFGNSRDHAAFAPTPFRP